MLPVFAVFVLLLQLPECVIFKAWLHWFSPKVSIWFFSPDYCFSVTCAKLILLSHKGDTETLSDFEWQCHEIFRDVTASSGTCASACWDALQNVQLSAVHSLLKCHGTDVVQLPVSHWDYSLRPRLARPLSWALRWWSLAGKYVSLSLPLFLPWCWAHTQHPLQGDKRSRNPLKRWMWTESDADVHPKVLRRRGRLHSCFYGVHICPNNELTQQKSTECTVSDSVRWPISLCAWEIPLRARKDLF